MRKAFVVLGAFTVALMMSSAFAQEGLTYFLPNYQEGLAEGDLYTRQPMPAFAPARMPMSDSGGFSSAASSEPVTEAGPVSFSNDMTPNIGSALVAPRGGVIYSPRMRADREIARVIRRLN